MTHRVNWTHLLVFTFTAFVLGCCAGMLVVNRHNSESVLAAEAVPSNTRVPDVARHGTDVEIRDSMEVVAPPVAMPPVATPPRAARDTPARPPAAKPEMVYVVPLQAPITASPADIAPADAEAHALSPAVPPIVNAATANVEVPTPPPPVAAVRQRPAPLVLPQRIRRVAPEYPPFARVNRIEGTVIIAATIDTEGNVTYPRVVKSFRLLDQSALDAVQQWQFKPGTRDGQPVPVDVMLTVEFSLR
jgi:protein TonB